MDFIKIFSEFGFACGMTVVLLGGLYLFATSAKVWILNKDKEARDREKRLSDKLDEVRDQQISAFQCILKDNIVAMNNTSTILEKMINCNKHQTEVMIRVDATLQQVRHDLLGSSDKHKAIENLPFG